MNKYKIRFKAYMLMIRCKIYEKFYEKPTVMTETETIDYILKNRCSIGRLGDGELDIMLGVNWKDTFQKYNGGLSRKLRKLRTDEKFLLCIPDVMMPERFSEEKIVKKEYDFWRSNLHQFLGAWCKYASKSAILGNSFVSRFYIRNVDKSGTSEYVAKLKRIWEDRDVIFVEGEQSRLGIGNDLFRNARSVKRILCPAKNAFDKYDEILKTTCTYARSDSLIIIALGQTATVLAKDLSKNGFQALDLGHVDIEYEWFKKGVLEKVAIEGKYVNEAPGGRSIRAGNADLALEQEYKQQIITIL